MNEKYKKLRHYIKISLIISIILFIILIIVQFWLNEHYPNTCGTNIFINCFNSSGKGLNVVS